MIRSVLLALDGSPASEVATELAIQFVQHQESETGGASSLLLTGIAVLDSPTISKPQATPMGAGGFKEERDKALLEGASGRVKEILAHFDETCRRAGVAHEILAAEGLPHSEIERAAHKADMILIGKDTNFHFATSDETGETVKLLLRDHPRPVVVYPNESPTGKTVLIAYDGSIAASRTLQMWALLGIIRKGRPVNVISINSDRDRAQGLADEGTAYLHRHGIEANAIAIDVESDTTDLLLAHVQSLDARMLVMGAFGYAGLRERFFGSSARRMIEKCPIPMFLYH